MFFIRNKYGQKMSELCGKVPVYEYNINDAAPYFCDEFIITQTNCYEVRQLSSLAAEQLSFLVPFIDCSKIPQ